MADTMENAMYSPTLQSWLGGWGSGSMYTESARELRARVRRNRSAPPSCGADHYSRGQIESKALALVTGRSVFILTPGHPTAQKLTPLACAPCAVPISVSSMGPRGRGDAKVDKGDVLLVYNSRDHYNALVVQQD